MVSMPGRVMKLRTDTITDFLLLGGQTIERVRVCEKRVEESVLADDID